MAVLILVAHLLLILGPGSLGRLPASHWSDARQVLVTMHPPQDAPAPRPATAASDALALSSLQARTSGQPQLHTAALAGSPGPPLETLSLLALLGPNPTPSVPIGSSAAAATAQPTSSAAAAPAAAAPAVAAADLPATSLSESTPEDRGWQAIHLRIPPAQSLAYALTGRSRGRPLEGEAELGWRHDGQQYEAHMRLRWATGLREMSSTGRLTAEGLRPDRFSDRTQGRGELAAHFETTAPPGLAAPTQDGAGRESGARVRFSGNQPDAELPAGAQDRLSVVLQLAARVAGLGRPLQTGETLEFPVATARAAATWRFRYEGKTWLPGPGGSREALHLRRRPEGPHDLDIELWLAPDLDYLPLQWRLAQDNGDWLVQRWTGDYRP